MPEAQDEATIAVMVRDYAGQPVSGLRAEDFIIKEGDRQHPVLRVEAGAAVTPNMRRPDSGSGSDPSTDSNELRPYVLLLITPMSASGRHAALRSAIRFLSQQDAKRWRVAVFTDSGTYLPFTEGAEGLKARLEALKKQVPTPEYAGGRWITDANRATEDLGIMPGRRALVVVSDYESKQEGTVKQNPNLLRVEPAMFIGAALRAQAAIYSVQASGPMPVVPFGSAESSGYGASGSEVAARIASETMFLGGLRNSLLYAASETGGLPENDVTEAFHQIEQDAHGYYVLHFQPEPEESDGDWHTVLVSVRPSNLHVTAARFYRAPLASSSVTGVPEAVSQVMHSGKMSMDLKVAGRAWFFPDGRNGVYTLPLAADVAWNKPGEPPDKESSVQLYVRLKHDGLDIEIGFWRESIPWATSDSMRLPVAHWQDEVLLYPGAYTLKVVAMDSASHLIGSNSYSFLVHSVQAQALRFSSIAMADRCLSRETKSSERLRLIDPIEAKECRFDLVASSVFPLHGDLKVLLRVYADSDQLARKFMQDWTASMVIADSKQTAQRTMPLSMQKPDLGGIIVTGALNPEELSLGAGRHRLAIIFQGPRHERFATETEFTLQNPQ